MDWSGIISGASAFLMKRILAIIAAVLVAANLSARPKAVIFDTDWWTDVDDACAIRILHSAHKDGLVDIKGICLSALDGYSVESLSTFMNYEGMEGITIGADKEATDFPGKSCFHEYLAKNGPEATFKSVDEIEDAVEFYRRILSESRGRVDIIVVGFPNTIARLLESKPDSYSRLDGIELVRRKAGTLWIMAGKYPDGSEHNFNLTERSRKAGAKVCEEWPGRIVFLGYEIGIKVQAGGTLPEGDLLRKILILHNDFNGRDAWDPMTVYMACLGSPEKAGFNVIRGRNSVNPEDGSNLFTEGKGRHSYVTFKASPDVIKSALDGILTSGSFLLRRHNKSCPEFRHGPGLRAK